MAFDLLPTISSVLGLQPANADIRVMNRTGGTTTIGDLVMFDLQQLDSATTNYTVGDTASAFVNVVEPDTTNSGAGQALKSGLFAICLEAAADNAEMKVRVRGIVTARVDSTGERVEIGDALFPSEDAETLTATAPSTITGTAKVLGIAMSDTTVSTETDVEVLFDGIHGFGFSDST